MNPERQKQIFQRATELLRNGDAEAAENLCKSGLLEFPRDPNLMCLSGRALIMLGNFAEAEERVNTALTMYPEFSRPQVVRGEMRLHQGRHDQAADAFRRAIELGDSDPTTRIKLGRALASQGDRHGAGQAIDETMRLDPVRKRLADGFELELAGKLQEAEDIYRDVLKVDPDNVDALRLLAGVATAQRQHRDAETLLKRALELAPDFGRAMANLVVNLVEQEKLDEALEYANRLTRIAADNADSFLLLGNALSAAGRYDDAIGAYRKSLNLQPDHPGSLSGLAHNLKTVGRQDEAIAMYRKCIAANPFFTEPYWSLANLKTFRFTKDEVTAMETLCRHPNIPDDALVHLHAALGFQYENLGDYDKAFACFEKSNATRRKLEYYDPVETEFLYDRIIDVFDANFVQQSPATAKNAVTPIFIVGLPRSGSTLLEQILASHSQVEGTHELSDLARVVREIPERLRTRATFPDALSGVGAAGFAELGRLYLERTQQYRRGSPYFTDKNPNNFVHAGLVHLALPDAVIIDARRHPLDSCLGCYKQLFALGQAFSYDLEDIGEYYLQYDRLMKHWAGVLPDKVLDVHYEDVVADVEGQVRRILDHCGLPFEAQCIRFHETERAVKTASSEQVRKPIYSSSVNLWQRYEKHLAPLIAILEPVLRELPENDRPA